MEKLFLIDGNAVAYRAFFAIKSLATSYGQPTNAVLGFLNILNRIVRETAPDYLACAFDSPGETFRHQVFAEYKVNRPGMPEELVSQLSLIKEVLSAYQIPILEQPGLEADDILKDLAVTGSGKGFQVYIVTADKDLLQLVSERIKVFHPQTYEIMDREKVQERFGLPPEKIPDLMALTGDSIDNIPGVKGIGDKTAVPLIQRFGSIENLYQHLEEVPGAAVRQKLVEGKESAFLSKCLATLFGAPSFTSIPSDFSEYRRQDPDKPKLAEIYRRLEFRKLLKEVEISPAVDYLLFTPNSTAKQDVAVVANLARLKEPTKVGNYISIDFADLLQDPKPYISSLASPNVLKAGTDLKDKLRQLHLKLPPHLTSPLRGEKTGEGVGETEMKISPPFFDFNIAAVLCEKQAPAFAKASTDASAGEASPALSLRGSESDRGNPASEMEEIFHFYQNELKIQGLTKLFEEVEMPLLPVLSKMEKTGVYLDTPYLRDLGQHFDEVLKNLESEIFQIAGQPFNLNSPAQLSVVLFENLKLPVVRKTKTGFSTDSSVLDALAPLHPVIPLILNYRQIAKLNSTYVQALPELVSPEDNRLHTTFNQVGAATGRLSSEKPNLQNIPLATPEGGSIRRAFCRQNPGDILCSFDYSQIELRILAHLSQDSLLVNAFREDRDIHAETARVLFHTSSDSPLTLSSLPRGERKGEEVISPEQRRIAKTVNFGIIYGMSAFGLAKELRISPEEAQNFITAYFEKYAGVNDFIDRTIESAREKGYVTTLLGRKRSIPGINSRRNNERLLAERLAVNTPIQGSAADIIKVAMVKIDRGLTNQTLSGRMILQIHDELLFEIPETEKETWIPLVKNAMEKALPLSVPVKVSIKSGRNWQDMSDT
ncbi:MAG: DNA polymerase I [Candidatus Ratteibacteria bacterium]|jgi:DNA polymerase-1